MKKVFKSLIYVPKPLLQKYSYRRRLSHLKVDRSRLVIFATLPRSGTHLLQQLIANSFHFRECLAKDHLYSGLSLEEVTNMMPNNWHLSYFNYHKYPFRETRGLNFSKPSRVVVMNGFSDVTRSHAIYQKHLFNDSLLIHLRRNPLDYFVSLYFYKYQKRGRDIETIRNPFDVYLKYRDYFVRMIKSYDYAKNVYGQRIRIYSYEELIESTHFVLFKILLDLGIDLSIEQCELIAKHCTIAQVMQQEDSGAVVNPTAHKLIGSFTNGGSIGKWKDHFDNVQADEILNYLSEQNIDINNFQFLPSTI